MESETPSSASQPAPQPGSQPTPPAAPAAKPRRRWFRRIALGSALAIVAAGIGWKIGAHHHGWHNHRAIDPERMDARLERMLGRFYSRIDATEAQKQKLGPIVKTAVKDLLPARDRLRATRRQAVELLNAETVDRAAIERLRAEQLRLADDASKRLTQAIGDAAEVLTPAQRKDLAARIERFAGRRHG
jgi:Spy/CpxP family protein refolding chaperone